MNVRAITTIQIITDEQLVYWDVAGGLSLSTPHTNSSTSLVPLSITVLRSFP